MTPLYFGKMFDFSLFRLLLTEVPWESATEARQECFMSNTRYEYTYGTGRGKRTYRSVPFHVGVQRILARLNALLGIFSVQYPQGCGFNVCFLNRYANERQHLGWHADDTPGMLHEHPIAVVSFGAAREIWWRPNGQTGPVPTDCRKLLEPGSLFIMPSGFQLSHQHRIPKHGRPCGDRISLTFRRYVPPKCPTNEEPLK